MLANSLYATLAGASWALAIIQPNWKFAMLYVGVALCNTALMIIGVTQ